jgi:hypothetical protein
MKKDNPLIQLGKIGGKDLLLILVITVILATLEFVFSSIGPKELFLLALSLLLVGANLVNIVIKKTGSMLIFFILFATGTYFINDFGLTGTNKVVALLFVGLFYEITSLVIKFSGRSNTFSNYISLLLATPAILILVSLFTSSNFAFTLPDILINLLLSTLLISFVITTIFIILWRIIKNKEIILKMESYFGSLKYR